MALNNWSSTCSLTLFWVVTAADSAISSMRLSKYAFNALPSRCFCSCLWSRRSRRSTSSRRERFSAVAVRATSASCSWTWLRSDRFSACVRVYRRSKSDRMERRSSSNRSSRSSVEATSVGLPAASRVATWPRSTASSNSNREIRSCHREGICTVISCSRLCGSRFRLRVGRGSVVCGLGTNPATFLLDKSGPMRAGTEGVRRN